MRRIIAVGLIVAGFLLFSVAAAWVYLHGNQSQRQTGSLPASVSGLPLASTTTGTQAIADVSQMHGKQFPIAFAAIGVYGDQQITLWVAGASSDAIASEMVNEMQAKIAKGNSPFTPLREFQNRGRQVYVLQGMGQTHYYFQSKNQVLWLAADPSLADDAIQQILEVYP